MVSVAGLVRAVAEAEESMVAAVEGTEAEAEEEAVRARVLRENAHEVYRL